MTRRLERERRLIGFLRRRNATAAERAIRMADLDADDQATARDLISAGLVRRNGESCYLEGAEVAAFRRKRLRLALASAAAALGLAALTVFVLLRR